MTHQDLVAQAAAAADALNSTLQKLGIPLSIGVASHQEKSDPTKEFCVLSTKCDIKREHAYDEAALKLFAEMESQNDSLTAILRELGLCGNIVILARSDTPASPEDHVIVGTRIFS